MRKRFRRPIAVATSIAAALGLSFALAACAPAGAHCFTTANGGDNDTQTTVTATGNRAPETYTLNHSTGGDHTTRTQTGKRWDAPATTSDMFSGPTVDGLKVRGTGTFNCQRDGVFTNVEAGPTHTSYTTFGGRNGIEVQQASYVIDHAFLNHNGFGVAATTNPSNSAQDGHDLRIRDSWFEWNYNGAFRNDQLADGIVLEDNLFRCMNTCIRSKASSNLGVTHATLLDGNVFNWVGVAAGDYGVGPAEQCSNGVGNPCDGNDFQGWFENGTPGSTGVQYALWDNEFYAQVYPEFGNLAPPALTDYNGAGASDNCHDNVIDIDAYGWTGAEKSAVFADLLQWQNLCGTGLTVNYDDTSDTCTGTGGNVACVHGQGVYNAWISTYGTGF